jgi:hypothetical protein
MKNLIESNTKTVEFCGFNSVEPMQLISFNKKYLDHVTILKNYLYRNQGRQVQILLVRINQNGLTSEKIITGNVGQIMNNQFNFTTSEDFSGVYDYPQDRTFRFDNVLGNVPLLPTESKIKPFKIGSSELFSSYFCSLLKMRKLLKECVNITHAATLYYRYCKEKPSFRNGNYKVECEILKVNQSNVQFQHFRTFSYVNSDNSYVNIVPYVDFDRFIAPDRYLQKVNVNFGIKHSINLCDDE